MQVWTYNGRVAFVLSVTERGVPVSEHKLEAFQGRLLALMDHEGEGIVRIREVGLPAISAARPCCNESVLPLQQHCISLPQEGPDRPIKPCLQLPTY